MKIILNKTCAMITLILFWFATFMANVAFSVLIIVSIINDVQVDFWLWSLGTMSIYGGVIAGKIIIEHTKLRKQLKALGTRVDELEFPTQPFNDGGVA